MLVQLETDPFVRGQDSAPNTTKTQLGPVDTYFVTQTSLGTPFQTYSGRIAQKKGGTQAIRDYAELMVSSHITVNDALEVVMKRKAPVPPPTLLNAPHTGPSFRPLRLIRGQVSTLSTCEARSLTRRRTPRSTNMRLITARTPTSKPSQSKRSENPGPSGTGTQAGAGTQDSVVHMTPIQ